MVRYAYDALGRRISRDGPGGYEEFLYDGPNAIIILNDNLSVQTKISYYPGVDRPFNLRTTGNSNVFYYSIDHTGSVAGLYEFDPYASTDTVRNRYRYDVWGEPQGSGAQAVDNPLRFKSRPYDEDTGLYDFRNRWYDPDIGRFISEDPIGLEGGMNPFRFVGNDPIGGQDATGLSEDDPDDPCDDPDVEGYGVYIPSMFADYGVPGYNYYVSCEGPTNGVNGSRGIGWSPFWASPTGGAYRGQDAGGSGAFGANRVNQRTGAHYSHLALDVLGEVGQDVFAIHTGTVARIGYAYNGESYWRTIDIQSGGYYFREWYVEPAVSVGEAVARGQVIGTLQRQRYAGPDPHVHIVIRRGGPGGPILNPEGFIPKY